MDYLRLGNVAADEGLPRVAVQAYNTSLDKQATPAVYVAVGRLAQKTGRHEGALRAYEAALEIDPDHVETLNLVGLTYLQLGEPELAVPPLERAVALVPDNETLKTNLARARSRTEAPPPSATSGSEAAQGVEEIWNQKQLLRVIGTACASSYSIGQSRSLKTIEETIRIAEGLRAQRLDPCGGVCCWLQQFHGADFVVAADGDAITLTPEGAEKYQANAMMQAPPEAPAEPASAEVKAQRNAVFGELAAAAAKRGGSGAAEHGD